MKKCLYTLSLSLLTLPLFFSTGCAEYDYTRHISEARSDIFRAETDEFTFTLSCVDREQPYLADGVACEMTSRIEIVLAPVQPITADFCVTINGAFGGDMSFRNTSGDYYYSQGVESFPSSSVAVKLTWGEEEREFTATSVKNEKTLSVEDALSAATNSEKELIAGMTQNNEFYGEFYIRLLRRDKNFYYVGIIGKSETTVSLLIDAESGEVLARRESSIR